MYHRVLLSNVFLSVADNVNPCVVIVRLRATNVYTYLMTLTISTRYVRDEQTDKTRRKHLAHG